MDTLRNIDMETLKGLSTVGGGVFIHNILGTFYLWGTLSTYTTAYYRKLENPDLTNASSNTVFVVTLFLIGLFMNPGLQIANKIGPRTTCFIAGQLLSICVYYSSMTNNFYWFLFFYGAVQGCCQGMLYMVPIRAGVQYFPNHKGTISGIILGAYGLSTLISSNFIVQIINPENKQPIVMDDYMVYPDDVVNNFPASIRFLAIYFSCLTTAGSIMLFQKHSKPVVPTQQLLINNDKENNKIELSVDQNIQNQKQSNSNQNGHFVKIQSNQIQKLDTTKSVQKECQTVKEAFFQQATYQLFFMLFFSVTYCLLMASTFKQYGLTKINDDKYMSLVVGNLGSVCNGLIRVVVGYFQDKYGFRKVYNIVLVVQLIINLTLDFISTSTYLYTLWICLIFCCTGAHFVLFPTKTISIFGIKNGSGIYSIVYLAFGFANITWQYSLVNIKPSMSYRSFYLPFSLLTFSSVLLNNYKDPKYISVN